MIKHEGKEYRNLVEQVAKNKELINYILDEEGTLNQYGIKVIVEVENKAELDAYPTEELEYGDGAISRDNTDPEAPGYAPSVYIWTRANNLSPVAYWAYMGKIRGPQGVVGPQGPQGEKGDTGKDALYWVTGYFDDSTIDPAVGQQRNILRNLVSQVFSRLPEVGETFYNLTRNTETNNVFATFWEVTSVTVINIQYKCITFESTRGPQGLQGNQGPQGIQGPEGPIGSQGPRGEQGIDGGLYPAMQTYANAEEGEWGPQVILDESDPFYKMGYTSYNTFTVTDPDTNFTAIPIPNNIVYPQYKYMIQFFNEEFSNYFNNYAGQHTITFEAIFYSYENRPYWVQFISSPIICTIGIGTGYNSINYSTFLLMLEKNHDGTVFRVYTNGLDMEDFKPRFRYSLKQIME